MGTFSRRRDCTGFGAPRSDWNRGRGRTLTEYATELALVGEETAAVNVGAQQLATFAARKRVAGALAVLDDEAHAFEEAVFQSACARAFAVGIRRAMGVGVEATP